MIASANWKEIDSKIKQRKENKWENSVSSVRYSEYNVDLNWDQPINIEAKEYSSSNSIKEDQSWNRPISFGGGNSLTYIDELPS